MTERGVLSVSLRVAGVIMVVRAIHQIPYLGIAIETMMMRHMAVGFNPGWHLLVTVLTFLIYGVTAYIMIVKGDVISGKLIRDDKSLPSVVTEKWELPFFGIALRIIGVVCLIIALPEIIKYLYMGRYNLADVYGVKSIKIIADIIRAVSFLAISIYFIAAAEQAAEILYKAGKRKRSERDDDGENIG